MFLDKAFMLKTFIICIKAIPTTLEITLVSLILAVLPAYGIAMARIKNKRISAKIGALYVSFMRGTPILLQILIVYSLMPSLLNSIIKTIHLKINIFEINPIVYAFIVFTLNTIATLSEVFRSALQTIDKGQYEAALTCGLTKAQAYIRIIIPQAIVFAVPNICNLTVTLIKNTSLAFMMTVKDITAVAKIEAAYSFNYIEAYLDIFVIYIIVCSVVQLIFKGIEKHFTKQGVKNVKG
ncbi:MAG: amino acid ABC transporter permease [Treponema sp.]|nr:amino acid ABC transporter permease [Treponema sp.]